MGHYSDNCSHDLDTFWDELRNKCVPCHQHPQHPIRPGYEFSPNCGRHDDGGKSEGPYRPCAAQTFNNGRSVTCQPCSSCPQNYQKLSECNATTDTQCCESRDQTGCWKEALGTTTQQVQRSTTLRVQMSTSNPTTAKHIDSFATEHVNHQTAWIVLTVILVLSVLAFLLFIYIKKRRRRPRAFWLRDNILYTNQQSRSSRRTAAVNEEVALLQSETRSLEDILSPDIQSAPLQTVLDNLDVLEELVILLDPEIPGVKNTRHLASRCSFPATWITYTYSLRDSKSPLRAVLEGITTKHPDWTVGQLARLLREMDRNDAVAVLTKLALLKVV
ncbi:IGF-like family receptor 1 isoform X2 [Salvelinus fontinalis]|uniref:IGF-like family receptor 1 isoform X2 n=1 Tax=Salvelinus fontinalis TaxID=8038 RepID=UPI002485088C|nr:IGF-like family receptor 1 isoform X2 [Salvelinus fontinalis]